MREGLVTTNGVSRGGKGLASGMRDKGGFPSNKYVVGKRLN